jgi:hypothetical protein
MGSLRGRAAPGVGGIMVVESAPASADVLRLSTDGLLRAFGGGAGLIKPSTEGEAGVDGPSDTSPLKEPRFNAKPFMFFGLRGDGEVMGRSRFSICGGRSSILVSDIVSESKLCRLKFVAPNDDKGTMVMGDSGEDEGEGSVNEEESAVEIVVVGDESVDSEFCVEVESRCLCIWDDSGGLLWSLPCRVPFVSPPSDASFAGLVTTIRSPRLSTLLESIPYTDMKEGNWL